MSKMRTLNEAERRRGRSGSTRGSGRRKQDGAGAAIITAWTAKAVLPCVVRDKALAIDASALVSAPVEKLFVQPRALFGRDGAHLAVVQMEEHIVPLLRVSCACEERSAGAGAQRGLTHSLRPCTPSCRATSVNAVCCHETMTLWPLRVSRSIWSRTQRASSRWQPW